SSCARHLHGSHQGGDPNCVLHARRLRVRRASVRVHGPQSGLYRGGSRTGPLTRPEKQSSRAEPQTVAEREKRRRAGNPLTEGSKEMRTVITFIILVAVCLIASPALAAEGATD